MPQRPCEFVHNVIPTEAPRGEAEDLFKPPTYPRRYSKFLVQYSIFSPIHPHAGVILQERYEYDAYGNCYVLEPEFAPDPDAITDFHNPYLFTALRLDILDNGSLKLQYNRNRYYDQYTGRWLTHDPLGEN